MIYTQARVEEEVPDLAGASTGLQETLMDGVLQQLFVVTGHGGVSTAAPSVVADGHLEH